MRENHGTAKASGRTWFRFYAEVLNDPKVDRLPPSLFKTWTKLMCLACLEESGKLPSVDDIAYHFRMSAQDAAQQIDELILAGLIDVDENGNRRPHNWAERQFLSDSSTDRVRKFRAKRHETPRNVSCNVSRNANETVSETPPDFRLQTSESEEESNLLPSEQVAAREKDQAKDSDCGSGRRKRKGEVKLGLRRLAEGLGLPADEMARRSAEARSPSAYFAELFRNELRTRFPQAPPAFADAVIAGDKRALTAVYQLILEAAP